MNGQMCYQLKASEVSILLKDYRTSENRGIPANCFQAMHL